jgi:hypothetical protein
LLKLHYAILVMAGIYNNMNEHWALNQDRLIRKYTILMVMDCEHTAVDSSSELGIASGVSVHS